jgi:hypothetical protein
MRDSQTRFAESILDWTVPRLIGGGILAYSAFRGFLPRRPGQLLSLGKIRTLRKWMLGKTRRRLASALGPPRGVAGMDHFADAHVWYYPLPRPISPAMAVDFQGDVVRNVTILPDIVSSEISVRRR